MPMIPSLVGLLFSRIFLVRISAFPIHVFWIARVTGSIVSSGWATQSPGVAIVGL
jgi:hypothetical protein